jgi:cytochrome P450
MSTVIGAQRAEGNLIPPRIVPPEHSLSTLRYLATVVRNPLAAWPASIYREPVAVERFLGQAALFVMDPDLVRQVLVDEAERYLKPELMQRALAPLLGGGMVTADGKHWRRQRRIVAPLFHPREVAGYVPAMLAAAEREAARLSVLKNGAPLSLAHEMTRTTFDVVAETMLGGTDRFDPNKLARAINAYLDPTGWVIILTQLGLPADFPHPGRRKAAAAREYLRRVTADIVADRHRGGGHRHDLVQALIDAKDEGTGEGLDDFEIVDTLLTFIAAGHETTALALTWTLYLLSIHPEIEAQLLAEIDAAGGPDIGPDAIAGLALNRRVVSEALRLYPPAPSLLRSPAKPVRLAGRTVLPGELIFIPIYAIHRHTSLWPDPDRFDPDRFLPEAAAARHRYAYMPFGAGQRGCIGGGFAMLEATAILAKLLPRFRFEAVGRPPIPIAKITLRPGAGMPVRVHKR